MSEPNNNKDLSKNLAHKKGSDKSARDLVESSVGIAQEDIDIPVNERKLDGKFGQLSISRQVIALAIWPFFEQILNLAVSATDMILAGHLPNDIAIAAVDALGVAGIVGWLMGVILGSLGVGSTAVIARAIGGKNRQLANDALGQSILMAIGIGVIIGGCLYALTYPAGLIMNLKGNSLNFLVVYLHILLLVTPAQAVLLVGGACLRGAGDTRTPFFVMVAVNIVNVFFSTMLVFGPPPFGGHGVRGIAIGTVIAWLLGAVIIFGYMFWRGGVITLYWNKLKPHLETMKRILRVGIPNLLEGVGGTWLATTIVLFIVSQLPGTALIGTHMIAVRIESFSFQPGFALGIAAATLVGQYLGLGDSKRAQKAGIYSWLIAAALMSLVGIVFIIIPTQLASIITDVPMLINQAAPLIRICGAIQFFFAMSLVLSFALRGAGDTLATMKITYLSVFIIRVPGAFLLGYVLGLGLVGVWLALCGDLTVRGVLFAIRFFGGKWKQVSV